MNPPFVSSLQSGAFRLRVRSSLYQDRTRQPFLSCSPLRRQKTSPRAIQRTRIVSPKGAATCLFALQPVNALLRLCFGHITSLCRWKEIGLPASFNPQALQGHYFFPHPSRVTGTHELHSLGSCQLAQHLVSLYLALTKLAADASSSSLRRHH